MRGNQPRLWPIHHWQRSIPAYAGEPNARGGCCAIMAVYPRVCGGTGRGGGGNSGYAILSPRMRGNRPAWGMLVMSAPVYPRLCGGTVSKTAAGGVHGLSPRMRGNRCRRGGCRRGGRSIPAYAGEPCEPALECGRSWVYPRVCGGTEVVLAVLPGPVGLSPRMRGNQMVDLAKSLFPRSIPAYAGEPQTASPSVQLPPVYPRVCGGTVHSCDYEKAVPGLSPRMRGNRHHPRGRRATRVYPRVCGGTYRFPAPLVRLRGLSPRMRGNPQSAYRLAQPAGSIPAYAGEPCRRALITAAPTVYPRVCGGTQVAVARQSTALGLSPRMRGNRHPAFLQDAGRGSIPAYAGEPSLFAHCRRSSTVYPRVCGGTEREQPCQSVTYGLSPRMRGNHLHRRQYRRNPRSIPAYAGEPSSVRGGLRISQGLSLRMRGNHKPSLLPPAFAGSIPAYAGEPQTISAAASLRWVYPRVCGGTTDSPPACAPASGLSPRMRGNHAPLWYCPHQSGSIPAYAGEPQSSAFVRQPARVYPRVCGGTAAGSRAHPQHNGLSPRMRGNQSRADGMDPAEGSIPAYAGEPAIRALTCPRGRVYPRVCGGTRPGAYAA